MTVRVELIGGPQDGVTFVLAERVSWIEIPVLRSPPLMVCDLTDPDEPMPFGRLRYRDAGTVNAEGRCRYLFEGYM